MATATAPVDTVAKTSTRQAPPVRRIEPKEFTFRLADKWMKEFRKREDPNCGRLMIAMQDDIYWPYYYNANGEQVAARFDEDLSGKDPEYLPRSIRYISGAKSIFVDEQDKTDAYKLVDGRNRLLDNPANRDKLIFRNGEINVPSNDRTLKQFLHCRNQCRNQHPFANDHGRRAKNAPAEYEMLDFAYQDVEVVDLGAKKEKAYEIARTARPDEMVPHAKFLNISFTHDLSTEPKSIDRIRQDYKDFAYANPVRFLDTFGDPRIKLIFKINELIANQEITLNKVAGQAHWLGTGALIAQLPPDQAPVTFLAEFSLTKPGEEFSNNLRAFK